MPISPELLSNIEGILKEDYIPGLIDQFNDAHPFVSVLDFGGYTWDTSGEYAVMSLVYGREGGTGARLDGAVLPTPKTFPSKKAQVATKELYSRSAISEKQISATKNDAGAFGNLLMEKMKRMQSDAINDQARQLFGEESGAITNVLGVAGVVITVTDARKFDIGQRIDVFDATGATKRGNAYVIAVEKRKAQTVTVDVLPAGTIATDVIYIEGAKGAEMAGLKDALIKTDNTYLGIDRSDASNAWFIANQVVNEDGSNNDQVLDQDVLRTASNDAKTVSSGQFYLDLIFTTENVLAGYETTLLDQKRFTVMNGDAPYLVGGSSALMFDDKTIMEDRFADLGVAYGIASSSWVDVKMEDWQFMDKDGSIMERLDDYSQYQMTLFSFRNLATKEPRSNFVITDNIEYRAGL